MIRCRYILSSNSENIFRLQPTVKCLLQHREMLKIGKHFKLSQWLGLVLDVNFNNSVRCLRSRFSCQIDFFSQVFTELERKCSLFQKSFLILHFLTSRSQMNLSHPPLVWWTRICSTFEILLKFGLIGNSY